MAQFASFVAHQSRSDKTELLFINVNVNYYTITEVPRIETCIITKTYKVPLL